MKLLLDILLWLSLVTLALAVGTMICIALSWLFAGDERPQATGVPAPAQRPTRSVVAVGRASVPSPRPRLTLPALAIVVGFIAQECTIQRALAYELTSAPIWTEVEAGAELRRLAVSAA